MNEYKFWSYTTQNSIIVVADSLTSAEGVMLNRGHTSFVLQSWSFRV